MQTPFCAIMRSWTLLAAFGGSYAPVYTDPLHDTVVDKVTLITGGLLISKVRLMEEDNEVQVYGIGYCSRLCDLCACRPPMCTGFQRTT